MIIITTIIMMMMMITIIIMIMIMIIMIIMLIIMIIINESKVADGWIVERLGPYIAGKEVSPLPEDLEARTGHHRGLLGPPI